LKEERRRRREIRWKREMVIRRKGRGKVKVGGEVSRHDVCFDRRK